jgi:hypothetical protein
MQNAQFMFNHNLPRTKIKSGKRFCLVTVERWREIEEAGRGLIGPHGGFAAGADGSGSLS